jgi:hypothetical protein
VSLRFLQRIQDHLAYDNYRPVELGEVRRQMRVSDDDAEEFEQAVEMLLTERFEAQAACVQEGLGLPTMVVP